MTENKKKIVYSLTTTYPESENSITPKFVHVLNKELTKIGYDVTVIVPHVKGADFFKIMDSVKIRRFRYLPENFQINSSSIPNAIKTKKGLLKFIILTFAFFIYTIFICLKNKPDIIHAQWAFPAGVIAQFISSLLGCKAVITCHGAEMPLLKKYGFWRKVIISSMNKAAVITPVSDYSKYELVNMGVNEKKCVRINASPNFVNYISNEDILKDYRKKFCDENTKIILFIGRLVERKGIEYLITALLKTKFEKIHLIIAGDGILLKKLQDLSYSLKLNEKITFVIGPTDEERGLLHQISDIFVCPSIVDSSGETEAIPMVIPEAMKSKLPVIGSSVGGIKDIIKHEWNGLLVNQKDPDSIAKAMDRLFTDDSLRNLLIENSRGTVQEFFPEAIAKKFSQVFRKIIS